MSKARPEPDEEKADFESASIPRSAVDDAQDAGSVVVSHESLFASSSSVERCDACGSALAPEEEDDGGYGVRGLGVYQWVRGDESRFEKVPLCPSCAAAIGMTALARWEIEEEEG
jgi:hypothetical protein